MEHRVSVSQALDQALSVPGIGLRMIEDIAIREHKAERGDVLHRRFDTVTDLICVHEGWILTVCDMANGERQIIDIHMPGDVIGFEFLGFARASSERVALENVRYSVIPMAPIKARLLHDPQASAAVASLLSRKYAALQDRLSTFAQGDAMARLVYFIHHLSDKSRRLGNPTPDRLRMPLTQQDIADALGVTNVTINRLLGQLEKAGRISYKRGEITILDHAGLLSDSGGIVGMGIDYAATEFQDAAV